MCEGPALIKSSVSSQGPLELHSAFAKASLTEHSSRPGKRMDKPRKGFGFIAAQRVVAASEPNTIAPSRQINSVAPLLPDWAHARQFRTSE